MLVAASLALDCLTRTCGVQSCATAALVAIYSTTSSRAVQSCAAMSRHAWCTTATRAMAVDKFVVAPSLALHVAGIVTVTRGCVCVQFPIVGPMFSCTECEYVTLCLNCRREIERNRSLQSMNKARPEGEGSESAMTSATGASMPTSVKSEAAIVVDRRHDYADPPHMYTVYNTAGAELPACRLRTAGANAGFVVPCVGCDVHRSAA